MNITSTQILDALTSQDLEAALEILHIPILETCKGVTQNIHHQETVYEHLILTAKALPVDRPDLRLAGLLHDIGKPKSKIGDGDNCTFYKHEIYGARIAYDFMMSIKFDYQLCVYISRMVRHHMFRFETCTKTKTIKKWYQKNADIFDDLFLLRQADRAGNKAKQGRPLITNKMEELKTIVNEIKCEPPPLILAISGKDLIALGQEPGPLFGHVLGTLRGRVENEEIPNDYNVLLGEAQKLIRSLS